MKRAVRRTLKVAGFVLGGVLVLVLVAVLLVVFDKPLVRGLLRRQLAKSAGLTVQFTRLDYSLVPFRLTVEGLELASEDAFLKLDASFRRLEAKGDLWKLVRGVKPALESIDAAGASVRYEEKARSETPVGIEQLLLSAADALGWSRRIALSESRLELALLSGPVELGDLDLTVTEGPSPDVFGYAIGRTSIDVKDAAGASLVTTSLRGSGRLGFVSPYGVESDLALGPTRFKTAGLGGALDGLTLGLTGRLDRSIQELVVSRLTVEAPGLLAFDGRLTGRKGYGTFIQAEGRVRLDDLAAASALLGPLLPAEVRAAAPRGRARLDGTYVLQSSDQDRKDNLAATLTLEDVELDPRFNGRTVHLRASGRIDTTGPTADPSVSAELQAASGPLAATGASIKGAALRLAGKGSRSGVSLSALDVRLSRPVYDAGAGRTAVCENAVLSARGRYDPARREAVLTALDVRLTRPVYDAGAGRTVAFENAVLSARGRYDRARNEAVLTALDARFAGLAPLRLSGRYGLGRTSPLELRLEGSGLDIPAVRALAGPFLPPALAGWELGGALDLSLTLRRPSAARDDWDLAATAALAGAKFNDPSFTIAGEGLDPVLRLEASGSLSKGLSFKAGLDIGRGESLWKDVYAAWSRYPLKVEASGRFTSSTGAVEDLRARLTMPGVGAMDVTGAARLRPALSFDLAAETGFSLGPLTSLYAQAGVAEAARTKVEGLLGATLTVRKGEAGLSVGGRLRLADANVESPASRTLLVGVMADLPFAYQSAPAPDASLSETGFLRIGEFQSPFLSLKPIEVTFRAGPNALSIESFAVPLFGGRLELGRTVFRLDPATGAFAGVGSLALRDLDIALFPIQSPQFRLTGSIRAEFPRLDIGAERIAVSGRGEARVFGGQIVLRDLDVSKPFSPQRTISLNIDLVDLDLKKLTDEVPFGEVTGIVRGEVRDLVISYGQPDRFSFRLESVPRRGVPRTFSLKAVDNLTVLSSGEKASSGGGGFWMSFIRGFRYAKLGIASTLRNDTFTLSGTIHEGGTEYLVKKPALFGISVVNREPGKKISFKEMTGRLKRVGQSEK